MAAVRASETSLNVYHVRFEVLTVALMKIVFWDVTLYQLFDHTTCEHFAPPSHV